MGWLVRSARWLERQHARAGAAAARWGRAAYDRLAGPPVDPAFPWGRYLTRPRVEIVDGTNDLELQDDLVYLTRRGVMRRRPKWTRWDGASYLAWMLSFLGMKVDWRRRFPSCNHDGRCELHDEPAWLSHMEYFEELMCEGSDVWRALLEWAVVFAVNPRWPIRGHETAARERASA